jgi:hypothetical protein
LRTSANVRRAAPSSPTMAENEAPSACAMRFAIPIVGLLPPRSSSESIARLTTYDAAVGFAKDQWHIEAYGTNLGNSDASTYTTSAQFIKAEVPLRPRVLGIKIGYKF